MKNRFPRTTTDDPNNFSPQPGGGVMPLAEFQELVMAALWETHGTRYIQCGCSPCQMAERFCADLLEEYPDHG